MTGIGHHVIVGLWPCPMEFIGAHDRADDVIAALDDDRRYVADAVDLLDQTIFRGEKVVAEIMRLDSG